MSLTTIKRARITVLGAWVAVALAASPVLAQTGPPDIDQYLVYQAQGATPLGAPVILRDQFFPQPTTHIVDHLQYFMNPVEKDGTGIFNPRLHYTWWFITPQPFSRRVIASNKYGDHEVQVGPAEFLLNPALKFPQPGEPIPVANHYKCYRAQGTIPPRPVTLFDQFGGWQAQLTGQVEYFCNPTEKIYEGAIDPIIRPDAHMVCYRIIVPQPVTIPITFLDQFRLDSAQLLGHVYLCVPTFKHEVVPTTSTTWGSVKATYR
jgi:hypothetical protein